MTIKLDGHLLRHPMDNKKSLRNTGQTVEIRGRSGIKPLDASSQSPVAKTLFATTHNSTNGFFLYHLYLHRFHPHQQRVGWFRQQRLLHHRLSALACAHSPRLYYSTASEFYVSWR
ncbi:hypothetical protein K443DRAFT_180113 [Laccaria amethystina LaAM-08-1]|uniref:Uncharacterized protein n=1 Tax=Laccaria amethystina LaAM-08-1 TaxID=1095629 RepID=A0A0C9X266_9AGAR|nr:hypothetical protein K443DRAFT_180113 [Laccaria amethystina LaAM-08-1]